MQNPAVKFFCVLFLASILSSCAFSSKFSGPKYNEKLNRLTIEPDHEVVLALTNAKLQRSKRSGFDKRSKEIFENINSSPGYIGGTVKFEIFGDEVWTMTVWENQEALERFVDSTRHLDAMYMTNQAMKQFRHFNIKVPARELPYSWSQAEKLLNSKDFLEHKPF